MGFKIQSDIIFPKVPTDFTPEQQQWADTVTNIIKNLLTQIKDDFEQMDSLYLTDGITAPSAVAGKALVYIDTSDGDLKIIFSDSTVRTIVTD